MRIIPVYPVGDVYEPSDLLMAIRKRAIVHGVRGGYRGETWEITDEQADALIAAHDAHILDETAERGKALESENARPRKLVEADTEAMIKALAELGYLAIGATPASSTEEAHDLIDAALKLRDIV